MARRGQVGRFRRDARLFAENEDVLFSQGVGTSYGFSGNTALHWAAAKGHAACVRWLYECGIDPNVANNGNGTAAHSAAGAGALETLRVLAHECGARMDVLNSVDETPSDVAAHAKRDDLVEFLRTAPALEALRDEIRARRRVFDETRETRRRRARVERSVVSRAHRKIGNRSKGSRDRQRASGARLSSARERASSVPERGGGDDAERRPRRRNRRR